MRPSFLLGAVSLVLMLMGSTDAEHCTTWSTSHPEVSVDGFYVDNDVCQPECVFSIWLYEEGNGIPGLQRGDEVVDDTCHGMIESDTVPCKLLPMALLTPAGPKKGKAANAAMIGLLVVGAVAAMPTADAC